MRTYIRRVDALWLVGHLGDFDTSRARSFQALELKLRGFAMILYFSNSERGPSINTAAPSRLALNEATLALGTLSVAPTIARGGM